MSEDTPVAGDWDETALAYLQGCFGLIEEWLQKLKEIEERDAAAKGTAEASRVDGSPEKTVEEPKGRQPDRGRSGAARRAIHSVPFYPHQKPRQFKPSQTPSGLPQDLRQKEGRAKEVVGRVCKGGDRGEPSRGVEADSQTQERGGG